MPWKVIKILSDRYKENSSKLRNDAMINCRKKNTFVQKKK